MLNNFRRIFDFDKASLNSNSSVFITLILRVLMRLFFRTTRPLTRSERIVKLHCSIREQLGELMPKKNSQDILVAAEALHGESNEIPFLEHLLEDLTNNGVAGEAFQDAMDLAGIVASSPLEQFTILPLISMKIGNLYFSFTNPSLFMLLTLSLILLLLHFVTKNGGGKSVPNAWQSLVELLYDFVLNPINEQIGGLSGNIKQKVISRIPYSFTVTSHFLLTLGLSFSIFIGITIVGFQRNGLHFLSFLLPAGGPLSLAPFLVLLELIPHCFHALSSGICLFANMMAGHNSVKILIAAWTMLCMNDLLYFIGDPGPLFILYHKLIEELFSYRVYEGLGADEAFLLSSQSALAPDLELAVLGLRPGFFLESLPFRYFRPLPLAWSRLPLAKYFQSSTSRLTTCAAPKSWTFWRRLEPVHEIKEPVLFRHIKNVQGELRKMTFTYSRMGPVCFRLVNMADHNWAGKLNSISLCDICFSSKSPLFAISVVVEIPIVVFKSPLFFLIRLVPRDQLVESK
ncbi:hypothetical protein M9H77_26393 [Catharanthus roseus]|uniref:Uncharacterized protein n=1 Tax=Catharanthus roseus TaxID=4058 RepID=A0ACC0AB26_CATRO|nr:hypothetical protein M9H77_26393 [Catharanthus roseus]